MSQSEIIEGEAIEVKTETSSAPATSTAVATRASSAVAEAWTPSFVIPVDQMVHRVEAKHEFFTRVMREGDHYGKIPGTDKPALLKPGAELLLSSMGLYAEFEDADPPTIDYGEDNREGLIRYRRRCLVFRQMGDVRTLIAKAEGSCSSREEKYRWRNEKRSCPECGNTTIIVGKKEYGGGFLCWKKPGKSDGCGAKFDDNDQRIVGQVTGKIVNPNLADVENTILKMGDKRALVAATLIATGCSDIFTQDIEEQGGGSDASDGQAQSQAANSNGAARTNGTSKTDKVKSTLQQRNGGAGNGAASAPADGGADRARDLRNECLKLRTAAKIAGTDWVTFLKEASGLASLLDCNIEQLEHVVALLKERVGEE
ncbi:MAG: hypothetical protein ACREML_00125 [Vulcanimicrobiaceae bacterium]